MSQIETHYSTLQVAETASLAVIRASYKALIQQFHPDRYKPREAAEELTKKINVAYGVLSDEDGRARYDRWLANERANSRGAHAHARGQEPPPASSSSSRQPPPPPPPRPPPVEPKPEPAPAATGVEKRESWWAIWGSLLLTVIGVKLFGLGAIAVWAAFTGARTATRGKSVAARWSACTAASLAAALGWTLLVSSLFREGSPDPVPVATDIAPEPIVDPWAQVEPARQNATATPVYGSVWEKPYEALTSTDWAELSALISARRPEQFSDERYVALLNEEIAIVAGATPGLTTALAIETALVNADARYAPAVRPAAAPLQTVSVDKPRARSASRPSVSPEAYEQTSYAREPQIREVDPYEGLSESARKLLTERNPDAPSNELRIWRRGAVQQNEPVSSEVGRDAALQR